MRGTWLATAVFSAFLCGSTPPSASAAGLTGTTWVADDCDFDFIRFAARGAAEVILANDDEQYADATWTIRGAHVHLNIPDWSESFDGMLDGDALSGTTVIRDNKNGDSQFACHFGKWG